MNAFTDDDVIAFRLAAAALSRGRPTPEICTIGGWRVAVASEAGKPVLRLTRGVTVHTVASDEIREIERRIRRH